MAQRAQTVIEAQLARGVELRLKGVSGVCEDILHHKRALFTFAFVAGVDPTNNHAERALRLWEVISCDVNAATTGGWAIERQVAPPWRAVAAATPATARGPAKPLRS
jgi:hypothetical protein